jgi:hypothetical protein
MRMGGDECPRAGHEWDSSCPLPTQSHSTDRKTLVPVRHRTSEHGSHQPRLDSNTAASRSHSGSLAVGAWYRSLGVGGGSACSASSHSASPSAPPLGNHRERRRGQRSGSRFRTPTRILGQNSRTSLRFGSRTRVYRGPSASGWDRSGVPLTGDGTLCHGTSADCPPDSRASRADFGE